MSDGRPTRHRLTGEQPPGPRRVAVVDVDDLPLQLLLRAHPTWAPDPVAVVEADDPMARVLFVNRPASSRRVRVGQRYAAALSLSRDLKAGVVTDAEVDASLQEMVEALQRLTPRVEPDLGRPGVLWLDPSGLGALFGPLERWGERVHAAVRGLRLEGTVVIGFARLPAWVVGRVQLRGGRDGAVFVCESPLEEASIAARGRLADLPTPPGWVATRARAATLAKTAAGPGLDAGPAPRDPSASAREWAELRDAVMRLGVRDVGSLLSLPRGEVGVRFGPRAAALHALLSADLVQPMTPEGFAEPLQVDAEIDPPDHDLARLLFCIKGALHALVLELAGRALALASLVVRLTLDGPPSEFVETTVEPAAPTRDAVAVLELVRLRLTNLELSGDVAAVRLIAEPARLDGTQLTLFGGRRRDPDAARRSIARLRAAFGDAAVTRAELTDGWLPEHSFSFRPTDAVDPPVRASGPRGVLVRRLWSSPEELRAGPDGRPRSTPPLTSMTGPYRFQGGWWSQPEARDYFYAERGDGALLWIFRDRRSRRWFLHGVVD